MAEARAVFRQQSLRESMRQAENEEQRREQLGNKVDFKHICEEIVKSKVNCLIVIIAIVCVATMEGIFSSVSSAALEFQV